MTEFRAASTQLFVQSKSNLTVCELFFFFCVLGRTGSPILPFGFFLLSFNPDSFPPSGKCHSPTPKHGSADGWWGCEPCWDLTHNGPGVLATTNKREKNEMFSSLSLQEKITFTH